MVKMTLPPYIPDYSNFDPTKDTVWYSGPFWDEKEINAAVNSIQTGKWITSGIEVAKFQSQFSKKFDVKFSHMVNSGSSANLVMLAGLKKYFEWPDGSEIIVSPVGFPTTIAPIVQNGLVPVFVDIEMDTLNFDVSKIEGKITPKTVAIMVSPVLGNPPRMEIIDYIARLHDIKVIGDSCDSLGSCYDGKPLGVYYDAWSCSFYPAHHISTGEGGMICTNSESLDDLFRTISWWGRDCWCVGANNQLPNGTCGKRFSKWLPNYEGVIDHKYCFNEMGYNLKPLDLQGAIGQEQLKKFDKIHAERMDNYDWIKQYLVENIEGVRVVRRLPRAETSWFGVPIICNDRNLKERLVAHFEGNRVQTRNYFAGNILLHPGYEHLGDYKEFPNANKALSHVFFLGCAPMYTEAVLQYIESVCKKWQN